MKKMLLCSVCTAMALSQVMAADGFFGDLEEALKGGSVSGHVGIFSQFQTLKGDAKATSTETLDDGTKKVTEKNSASYVSPSASILYETAPISYVSVGMGAWANGKAWENMKGAYSGAYGNEAGIIASNTTVNQMYAKVEHPEQGFIKVGRQEVGLTWANYYIEGIVGAVKPVEGLDVVAFWANKRKVLDFQEVSSNFSKMNENRGVYGLEVNYALGDFLVINPYYYHASKLIKLPGIKLTASFGNDNLASDTMIHFAKPTIDGTTKENEGTENEKIVNIKNKGYFFNIEETITLPEYGTGIGFGYMQADKKVGAEGINSFGDDMPMQDFPHIFSPNAKTLYGFVQYEKDEFYGSLLYARTKYDKTEDNKIVSTNESELDFILGYWWNENFQSQFTLININNKTKSEELKVQAGSKEQFWFPKLGQSLLSGLTSW